MTTALVLLSAFLHAAWNALLRLEQDKDRALIAAIGAAALVATAVAGARWAVGAPAPFPGAASLGWTLAAGALEVVYFGSLARALESGPLGPVYTISRGGALVLVWPLSIAVFGERPTVTSLAGSAVVLAGLALSSAGLPVRAARAGRGGALAWAAVCAAAIAGYHLAYKAALGVGGGPSAVFAVSLIAATAINLARLGAQGRRIAGGHVRARLPRVLLMGTICSASFLLLMEALAAGGAGFALTVRNTSVLFALGLAWAIGDRPLRAQVAGAVLVAAGAVLMAW
jgi:uncharacterized membrane protein